MKLINRVEKKQVQEAHQLWKLTHEEDNIYTRQPTQGGVLILSRILGHPEFESVEKPLFKQRKIDKARD